MHLTQKLYATKNLILIQIAQLGDKRFENPQTANLHRILVDTIAVHELMVEGEAKPLEGQKKKTQQVNNCL